MIKFEIIDISFKDVSINKFPLKRKRIFRLVPESYNIIKNTNEGIFKFVFLLQLENMGRINLNGTCRVLSDQQSEIEGSLKDDKKLLNEFDDKILYHCFHQSKMIFEKEGLKFPEIEEFFRTNKKKKG